MANEIRKIAFLVPPPAKPGTGGGTATESPKSQNEAEEPVEQKPARQNVQPDLPLLASDSAANAHLVIEIDEVSGGFIYKSVNRETGEVIKQYPREEVLRAIANARAAEGLVIDTKA